jgi:hypothetical protein
MSALKIVSFLPAATEMIYLLGLADSLVDRTHECDYPDEVKQKPIIVDCALDLGQMTMAQIDTAVGKTGAELPTGGDSRIPPRLQDPQGIGASGAAGIETGLERPAGARRLRCGHVIISIVASPGCRPGTEYARTQ